MTDQKQNAKLAEELCEKIQIFIGDAVNLLYMIDATNAFNRKPEACCVDATEKLLEYAGGFANNLSTVLFDMAHAKMTTAQNGLDKMPTDSALSTVTL